ncbi:MAG TPA: hypothetical protein VF263_19410 [Longimicrobiaceae bacterium]
MIFIDLGLPDEASGAPGVEDLRQLGGALVRDTGVRGAAVLLLVVGAACLGGELWLRGETARRTVRLAGARADSVAAQGDIDRAARLEAQRLKLGAGADAILRLEASRDLWPRMMDRLSRAIPANTWVDSIGMGEMDPQGGGFAFTLRGVGGSGSEVARLERALVGGVVTQASVVSTRTVRIGGLALVAFELEGRAASGGDATPGSGVAGYGLGEGAKGAGTAPATGGR